MIFLSKVRKKIVKKQPHQGWYGHPVAPLAAVDGPDAVVDHALDLCQGRITLSNSRVRHYGKMTKW